MTPDREAPGRHVNHYAVRHLERFPLGTPYPEIAARLAGLFAAPPLARGVLAVDLTAVGRPVLTLLRRSQIRARLLLPVTVTAGHRAVPDEVGGMLVPKKELVSTLQVLLQARRLKVAPTLPEAQTLTQELANFRMKVTPLANDMLDAWREGPHDDVVLAVALAAWQGERHIPFGLFPPYVVCSRPAWAAGP